jgi:shikimate kinase
MPDGSSVVLVGMPGAGKSTVGVLLAKRLSLAFLDTDLVIQQRERRTLQQIVDAEGATALRGIEEAYVRGLACAHTVIATGGSVIYSEPAMRRLHEHGRIVYLDVPLAELERRVTDVETRGLVRRAGQSLRALFEEREPLYRRWADVCVDCDALRPDELVERIVAALSARRGGEEGGGFPS